MRAWRGLLENALGHIRAVLPGIFGSERRRCSPIRAAIRQAPGRTKGKPDLAGHFFGGPPRGPAGGPAIRMFPQGRPGQAASSRNVRD